MNITYIEEDQQIAREKYREYRAALKVERDRQIAYLATIYWQLARGRKVIDAVAAISSAGLNEQGHPKLAIAEANRQYVQYQRDRTEVVFYHNPRGRRHVLKFTKPANWNDNWKRERAPLPIIPPSHIPPDYKLENLHLLWEVEKWEPVPSPDPMLLRRLGGPFFVVLATWNLTQVEMAVMAAGLRM
jgi:hypothetical protein